jgi:hypothetical protein
MQQWGYAVVQSQGGQVQTPGGTITAAQMLNSVGQRGGELVAVVPAGVSRPSIVGVMGSRLPSPSRFYRLSRNSL